MSALSSAGLQPLHLPDVGAIPWQHKHEGLAPHSYLLMQAIAQELVLKQEAINIAGQEVYELCWGCSKASLRSFHM